MSYFSHFGTVWHTLPDGSQVIVNDITKAVGFLEKYKTNPGFYLTYTVREGERPEQISDRLYGDRRFWWTIILFNNLCNFDDQWPMTEEVLDRYIAAKYPEQDYADVHHYEDELGRIADPRALKIVHGLATTEDAIGTFALTPVTIGDYEAAANEAKRSIRLINANHILKVEADLKEAFSG